MNIAVVGLNHKTAPIQLRERMAFSAHCLDKALETLKKRPELRESIVLSTCNRVELYAVGGRKDTNTALRSFLAEFHGVDESVFAPHLYDFSGLPAVEHLFRVSASLDSMIIGENQILGQVKTACGRAKAAGTVLRILPYVFEEAIKTGRKARCETLIGCGAVSVSTAAVELARKIFGDLTQKKILIIGAGKIGELSARYLHQRGIRAVFVANKTFVKAQELARILDGEAVEFFLLDRVLREVDIVISSVSAPHVLITKDKARAIMAARRQKPLFFIDLGLPRNIDPAANTLDNVYVYNLDDLEKARDANLEQRLKEVKKVEQLIHEQIKKTWGALERMFAARAGA